MTLFALALIALGALVACFVSGLSGFAFGMVSVAFWLHVIEPAALAPLVAACSLIVQGYSLGTIRRGFELGRLSPFILGGAFGVPVGIALLGSLDHGLFRTLVGGFLVLYATTMLLVRTRPRITAGGRIADAVCGFTGGLMGGFAGLPGPPPTIWTALRGRSRDEQRGVFQPFNAAMHVFALGGFASQGLLNAAVGILVLICLPAVFAGAWLGLRLYDRVDDAQFRRIVLILLLISGLTLVL
ncbi:MAG: sulfite exporter TauE/SafE family protein [Proteobacteria bacterium]|nr:sulfite exporter TauE/SafE family protein [Pseudomonadota bacterium]MBI3497407.1 sulfite exporter TauE/SafE family protein [Pseudomonadota bacterium]